MPARAPIPIRDLNGKDTELIRLALRRDGGAFRIIAKRHNRRLYRCNRSIARDDSEAEDIVREAYVSASASCPSSSVDPGWARGPHASSLSKALERVRRRRPTVELATLGSAEPSKAQIFASPLMTTNTDPECPTAQREIHCLIERAIDDLPELFRVVFVMREIEDMSLEETAGFLGLRPARVKYRLHRARRLLRKALDAQLARALTDAFPFDGMRGARMMDAILQRFGL